VDKFLTFTIVGLSVAAIYSVIASGLVLTYTTTGVFNFAHGAAGMLAAFCYWQFRFAWGWPAPLALIVVLLVLAPLFGVLLETVIMRNLEGTSETTRLVVSISLLVAMIGLSVLIWKPDVSRPMARFFQSSRPVTLGSTTITWHQIITLIVAVVVAFGLWLVLTRTRVGIAMRASVDDRNLTMLTGARPHRVQMLAWAIGTALAGIGGILIAPGLVLDASSLSLVIVSAYAAAIFGRLRSLPMTFVGAVVVGCAEGYLQGYLPQSPYLTGLRNAASVLILFVVLLVLPNPRLRGRVRSREFFPAPTWRGAIGFAAAMVVGGVVLATTLSRPDLITYGQVFSVGIVALSLVPLIGFAGQVSLCQLSFAGIGAVVMGHLGVGGNPLALLWAALIAGAVGTVVALPALRLSGIYLALGTASFAIILDRWLFLLPRFSVFGLFEVSTFDQGSSGVDALRVFGFSFADPGRQMILMAVLFAAASLEVVWIRRSAFGRVLVAMKDSEAACATLGIDLLGIKVAVFAVSAAMAGVGGALYASQAGSISPGNFDFVTGLPIFMMTVVGGVGMVGAALFAAVSLYAFLPLYAALLPSIARYAVVLPGLAGLSLARHPTGAVQDVRAGFLSLRTSRPAIVGVVGAAAVLYALRMLDVIGNWPFALLLILAPVVGNAVAQRTAREATAEGPPDVPLEWRGIVRPWTEDDRLELDRALAINEVDIHGAA
jgi:branched-chain amino acid transport system permease protein